MRALGWADGCRDANAVGRELRRRNVHLLEGGENFVAAGLERVGAQIDGARSAMARPSAIARSPKARVKDGISHSGMSAATCGAVSVSSGCVEAAALVVRSGRRGHGRCRHTRGQCRPARSRAPSWRRRWRARGVRSLPIRARERQALAQRVEDERADGCAIAGACEAMLLAPVLKGRCCWLMARENILEHFGRGLNPGARSHNVNPGVKGARV